MALGCFLITVRTFWGRRGRSEALRPKPSNLFDPTFRFTSLPYPPHILITLCHKRTRRLREVGLNGTHGVTTGRSSRARKRESDGAMVGTWEVTPSDFTVLMGGKVWLKALPLPLVARSY